MLSFRRLTTPTKKGISSLLRYSILFDTSKGFGELFNWIAKEFKGRATSIPFSVRVSKRQQKKSDPKSSETVTGLAQNANFDRINRPKCSFCQPFLVALR